MKQKLVSMFLAGVTLLGISLYSYSATPASALNLWQGCEGATDSKVCASKGKDNVANTARNLINLSLWAIGIVAVIMIVISGYKFITANGEAAKVTSARNTLLYSVIGLAVALLAWAIVSFIVNRI